MLARYIGIDRCFIAPDQWAWRLAIPRLLTIRFSPLLANVCLAYAELETPQSRHNTAAIVARKLAREGEATVGDRLWRRPAFGDFCRIPARFGGTLAI